MSLCPCGSSKPYSNCCEPIHNDPTQAHTPEELMRSRYCAHEKKLVDFVVNTYHPSCHAEEQRAEIAESIESNWCGLEVISSEDSTNENEGFVTFKAYFELDGQQYSLEERSRFIKESDQWFYIDGTFPNEEEDERLSQPISNLKVGRNDPCICGSGKKFKKCCG